MDNILNDYQDGLKIFDDLKEKEKEMEGVGKGVTESEIGMNGIMELTEGNKGSHERTGLANGTIAADSSSDSPERASDDTYSIGSFFSDLQSFGSDAAELLEESKKFFTKLGAVVAIIGTCINTAGTLANAIRDEQVKTAVFAGILLIGIQIPTTLAMLFVFLKDWIKVTITGFLKAKKELEELASDLESFADDTESDERVKDLEAAPSNAQEKADVETDELRRDLEKTKQKNNYNSVEELQKCNSIGIPPALEKNARVKQNTDSGFVSVNGYPHMNMEQSMRKMEEGENISEKTEHFPSLPRTDQKRELPNTPSSNRRKRIHGESQEKSSRPARRPSGSARNTSQPPNTSLKPIRNRDGSAPKAHGETPLKGRQEPHGSSSRVSSSQRQIPATSRRSEAKSLKRSDSRRERSGNPALQRTDPAKDRRWYGEKGGGSARKTSDVHRSQSTRSKSSRQSQSERTSKIQKKKTNQATQTMQEVRPIESNPALGERGFEKVRENINGESLKDKEITAKCWRWFWNRGSKK